MLKKCKILKKTKNLTFALYNFSAKGGSASGGHFTMLTLVPIKRNYKRGANTKETIAISLIRMFIDGPVVSLKGSPTVSPTTAAA